jgi:hypothetical protein
MDHDELLNRRVVALAKAHGCSVGEMNAALDRHPLELNRDAYLRRCLALELMQLDRIELAFGHKALVDRDVASGVLLVKVAERRATLLGLNAPIGHAVRVVSHPPQNQPTSTDRIEAALNALVEDQRRSQARKNGQGDPH